MMNPKYANKAKAEHRCNTDVLRPTSPVFKPAYLPFGTAQHSLQITLSPFPLLPCSFDTSHLGIWEQ